MTVLVYTGRPGVGKTLTLVDELYRLKESNGPTFKVFSNVRSLKVPGLEIIDFTQYFKSGEFLRQYNIDLDFGWLNETQLLELQQIWMCFVPLGSLILLDEIQNLYPSVDRSLAALEFGDVDLTFLFENLNIQSLPRRTALDFLKQGPFRDVPVEDIPLGPRQFFEKHRHYGYNVFGTCQNPSQVGRFLRSIVQELIYIVNGSAFGVPNLRLYNRRRGLDDTHIGEQWRWFSRSRRKLLYSSYKSEFETGLKITKSFSLKFVTYLGFILVLLVVGIYLLFRSWGIYAGFYNEGAGYLIKNKLMSDDKSTSVVKKSEEKVAGSVPNKKSNPGLLRWLIENEYTFEYNGYFLQYVSNRKIYTLALLACNKERVCLDLSDGSQLESFGIRLKVIDSCFINLKSDDKEVFLGCKQQHEGNSPEGKLFLTSDLLPSSTNQNRR